MVKWYQDSRNPVDAASARSRSSPGLAVLLASPSGGYINGQTIAVDGGHTISFR
jgi:dehydrogenase/reductase SDR family protein 4